MANTTFLRRAVEGYVRDQLADSFGQAFTGQVLQLVSGGTHEFDAVSRDATVVASIKSASGRTAGGNIPSGKIKDATAELYFLNLVEADTRLLVLTNPDFHAIFVNAMRGRIAPGVDVVHLALPDDLDKQAAAVHKTASDEMMFPTTPSGA